MGDLEVVDLGDWKDGGTLDQSIGKLGARPGLIRKMSSVINTLN